LGDGPSGQQLSAREALLRRAPGAPETAQVDAAYLNLIRMWSDL
jgi:hypothetical protein